MAKTVAEVSSYCVKLDGRLQVLDGLVVDLKAALVEAGERQHQADLEVVRLREQLAESRRQLDDHRALAERHRDEAVAARRELAEARQESALVRQRLDDHLKRVELWDTRRWGLVVSVALAVFGVAASFASGLILATLRTPAK